MHINIDTSEPLSDVDKQILTALTGGVIVATAPRSTPAPAKKTTPAPAKEPVTEQSEEPVAEEPADEGTEVSLADLKALASKVVAAGDAKKVKAALESVGAKKISEVSEADVAKVYAALDA